ncbi:MAG: glycosyltransferase family 2 protein [Phycisphaerales bacterium]|nr:glycosyltransferase family 2 protein [Phycisphaerales bacterium]
MNISIIIINYKTYQLTCNCIDSIIKNVTGVSYEIILVENGTDEFRLEKVAHWGDKIKLILSEENLGFAGGNNLGIQYAQGKYILLLNSDVYLTDDAITKTYAYLEQRPQVGVVSAKLVYPDGRIQSVAQRFPSVKYQLIELLRLQKLMNKRVAGKLLLGSFFDHNENVKSDWVWGAYFMFPRNILSKLPQNKLDDSYFMYYEDMQWCMDIKKLGYEVHFCAEATVVHLLGGSSAAKKELMEKNGALFLSKNYTEAEAKWIKKLNKWLLQSTKSQI